MSLDVLAKKNRDECVSTYINTIRKELTLKDIPFNDGHALTLRLAMDTAFEAGIRFAKVMAEPLIKEVESKCFCHNLNMGRTIVNECAKCRLVSTYEKKVSGV